MRGRTLFLILASILLFPGCDDAGGRPDVPVPDTPVADSADDPGWTDPGPGPIDVPGDAPRDPGVDHDAQDADPTDPGRDIPDVPKDPGADLPPAGACTGPGDSAILDGPPLDWQGFLAECGQPCFMVPDLAGCLSPCIAERTGLSPECSACFGAEFQCIAQSCMASCVTGPGGTAGIDDDACTTCRVALCDPAFEQCAGRSPFHPDPVPDTVEPVEDVVEPDDGMTEVDAGVFPLTLTALGAPFPLCDVNEGQAVERTADRVACYWQGWGGHCVTYANAASDHKLSTLVSCCLTGPLENPTASQHLFEDFPDAMFQSAYGRLLQPGLPLGGMGWRHLAALTRTIGLPEEKLFGWLYEAPVGTCDFRLISPDPATLDFSKYTSPALGAFEDRVFGVHFDSSVAKITGFSMGIPVQMGFGTWDWTDLGTAAAAHCPVGTAAANASLCGDAGESTAQAVVLRCLDASWQRIGTVVMRTRNGLDFEVAGVPTAIADKLEDRGHQGLPQCFTAWEDLYVAYPQWDTTESHWVLSLHRLEDGMLPWEVDAFGGPRVILTLAADPYAEVSILQFRTDGNTHWVLARDEGMGLPQHDHLGRSLDDGRTWSFHHGENGFEAIGFVVHDPVGFVLAGARIDDYSLRKGKTSFLYGSDPSDPMVLDPELGTIHSVRFSPSRLGLSGGILNYVYLPVAEDGTRTQVFAQRFQVGAGSRP